MYLRRPPRPELRPLVKELWYADAIASEVGDREYSLPTGEMHLVFRLSETPLRLVQDASDGGGIGLGHTIVGGARTGFYVKDTSRPACTVGAVLNAGASLPLFNTMARELAGRHTRLDELWGPSADSARSQILEAPSPAARLDLFESLLALRLPRVRGLHPAVAMALERFQASVAVRSVVAESGYSHRRFLELFRDTTGLPPKQYCRVRRFQRVLSCMAAQPAARWVDLALDSGYSDQAHFSREFRLMAGVTPGEYRCISPVNPSHVPVAGQFRSISARV
jgi:AraC-like DNA-binding protein